MVVNGWRAQAATALAQAEDDDAATEVADSCLRACAQSPSALKLPLVGVRLATALPASRQLSMFRLTVEIVAESSEGKLLKRLAASKEGAAAVLTMVDAVVTAAVASHVRPSTALHDSSLTGDSLDHTTLASTGQASRSRRATLVVSIRTRSAQPVTGQQLSQQASSPT